MEHTKELLAAIYDNADIGKSTLGRLIRRCNDATFRNVMAEQFAEYHTILAEAEQIAGEMGAACHCDKARKAPIFASLSFNVSIDKTSSHMAEMLVQGSVQGIIDINRTIRQTPKAEERVVELAKKLLETEEANLRQMYKYL